MRAIFINRFYWPDEPATAQLLTDLAESLSERGIEVTIICSRPNRTDVLPDEVFRGVRILRVGSSRSAGNGVGAKFLDFATFHVAALWRLLRFSRRGDAVVAMTDPPLLGIGAWLATALTGARLFHWVQDIYPELAIELSGQPWLRALRPIRNLAWRRADGCVTLGSDMAGVLAQAGVNPARVAITANWAPKGLAPAPLEDSEGLRREWGLQGKFVVEYSGNLGRVHDLDPLLAVARKLKPNPQVLLLFVGGGARRTALEAAASRDQLSNVAFRPPQPRGKLNQSLAVGNIHLVTVLPGCERLVFPSKLHGILAVGRPVIFIGPRECEIAHLVVSHQLGLAFDRRDTSAIAQAVQDLAADPARCELLGRNARQYAERSGGVSAAADRWQALLVAPGACGN